MIDEPNADLMAVLGKIAANEGDYVIGFSDKSPDGGDWLHRGGALSTCIGLTKMLTKELKVELQKTYEEDE